VLPPDAKPYQICKCDNGCYGLRVSRSGKLDSEHCEDACKRVGGSTYTNALVAGSRWWEIGKSYQDFASKYGSQALPKEIYDKVYENTSFCP
jgi:hypothetical protein